MIEDQTRHCAAGPLLVLAPLRTPHRKGSEPAACYTPFHGPAEIQIPLDPYRLWPGGACGGFVAFPGRSPTGGFPLDGQVAARSSLRRFDALVCPAPSSIPLRMAGGRICDAWNSARGVAIVHRLPEWRFLGCRRQQPWDGARLGTGVQGNEHPITSIGRGVPAIRKLSFAA